MSQTVGEASAVNVLARYVLVPKAARVDRGTVPPSEDQVRAALGTLLRGSYKRLTAGLTEDDALHLPWRGCEEG